MRILVSEKLSPHKMKTPEGYLICTDAILSRTGKQTYRRSELWGDACDNADEEVEVDRKAEEVFNDKTLASFENKPICIEHPDEDVNVNNHNQLSVGFVRDIKRGKVDGQDVMLGTLVITDADAVEAIERGDYTELSCGYNCDIVDEDNPQQRNIRGNHVALCERGRAGIARIVDSVNDAEEDDIKYGYRDRMAGVYDKWYRYNRKDGGRNYDLGQRLAAKEKNAPENVQFIEVMHDTKDAYASKRLLEKIEQQVKLNGTKSIGQLRKRLEGDMELQRMSNENIKKICKSVLNIELGDEDMKDMYIQIDMTDKWGGVHSFIVKSKQVEEAKAKVEKRYPELKYKTSYQASESNIAWAKRRNLLIDDDDWSEVEEENYKKANKSVCTDTAICDATVDVSGEHNDVGKDFYGYLSVDHPKLGKFYVSFKIKGSRKEVQLDGTGWNFIKSKGYTAEQKQWIAQHKSELERVRSTGMVADTKDSMHREQLFTIKYKQGGVTYINKVRANSIEDAIRKVRDDGHKVVVFTNEALRELGKNNSIGKYDRVVQAMRSLYSETLLPDDELKERIRQTLPRLIAKYVKE